MPRTEHRSTSNQSWQQHFQALNVSSSFGTIPGIDSNSSEQNAYRVQVTNELLSLGGENHNSSSNHTQLATVGSTLNQSIQSCNEENIENTVHLSQENLDLFDEDRQMPFEPTPDDELESDQQLRSRQEEEERLAHSNMNLHASQDGIRIRYRNPRRRNTDNLSLIDQNEEMPEENPEDDETIIDRHLRLQREEDERLATTNRSLLAPREELRIRNRQPAKKQTNTDNLLTTLREKQLELVNIQINLQKTLLENAQIMQKEYKERLSMTQRMNASTDPNLN